MAADGFATGLYFTTCMSKMNAFLICYLHYEMGDPYDYIIVILLLVPLIM